MKPGKALSRLSARSGREVLGLQHFIQRQRVLSLWRDVLRTIRQIPQPDSRCEMRSWARAEFDKHRDHEDLTHIRFLVSTGKRELQQMSRYVLQR